MFLEYEEILECLEKRMGMALLHVIYQLGSSVEMKIRVIRVNTKSGNSLK